MEPIIARELRKLQRPEKTELVLSITLVWSLVVCIFVNLNMYRHLRDANRAYVQAIESIKTESVKAPVPKLSEACPAWFYSTNLKVAKAEICKDYRK